MGETTPPAGWYPDPGGVADFRFWDGRTWKRQVADRQVEDLPRAALLMRLAVGLASIASLVVLGAAFGDGRRRLVVPAILLQLPLVFFAVRSAIRSRQGQVPSSGRHVAALITVAIVFACVAGTSGYRAWAWTSCEERLQGTGDGSGCDLSGRDLRKFNLRNANLSIADLSGARLNDVDLRTTDLHGANLRDATLDGADLSSADLRGADLNRADLGGAQLTRADLQHASLRKADLAGADLESADLRDAQLDGTSLASADLTRANLTGATLTRVNLEGASLVLAKGLTDTVLAAALDVDPGEVGPVLSEKKLVLEPISQIKSALLDACQGESVTGAGTSRSSPGFAVIASNATYFHDLDLLPHPPALRFAELAVCIGPVTETDLQTCGPYAFVGGGAASSIVRSQEHVRVSVVNTTNADILIEQTISGPAPAACPAVAPGNQTGIIGLLKAPALEQALVALLTSFVTD